MMTFKLRMSNNQTPQPPPHQLHPQPPLNNTNRPYTFSYGGKTTPKLLYIDIIGNSKPGGCKRCGK